MHTCMTASVGGVGLGWIFNSELKEYLNKKLTF